MVASLVKPANLLNKISVKKFFLLTFLKHKIDCNSINELDKSKQIIVYFCEDIKKIEPGLKYHGYYVQMLQEIRDQPKQKRKSYQ